MTQDDFLDRLWTDVINSVPHEPADLALALRFARYEAVFDWCFAFDEAGVSPVKWRAWPATHARWRRRLRYTAAAVKRIKPDSAAAPFADAELAVKRLLDGGMPAIRLATALETAAQEALAGIRKLLAKLKPTELEGLHESLLMADPSGEDGAPGSWPRPMKARASKSKASAGPLLELGKAFPHVLSADGRRVVSRNGRVSDVQSGKEVARCDFLPNTSSVTWSPDGRLVAAYDTRGRVALCDTRSGRRLRLLRCDEQGPAAVFSATGDVLFAGDWKGNVLAWSVENGRELARWTAAGCMVQSLARSGDDLILLLSHRPSPTEIVRLSSTLQERARITVGDWADSISLAPDGRRALLIGHALQWLDLKSRRPGRKLTVDEPLRNGEVSPSGKHVVLTVNAGFRLCPARTPSRCRLLERKYADSVSFSTDGELVVLSTWNGGEVWLARQLFR